LKPNLAIGRNVLYPGHDNVSPILRTKSTTSAQDMEEITTLLDRFQIDFKEEFIHTKSKVAKLPTQEAQVQRKQTETEGRQTA